MSQVFEKNKKNTSNKAKEKKKPIAKSTRKSEAKNSNIEKSSDSQIYCGIYPIPKGKTRRTPEYKIATNQVRYYGLQPIDLQKLEHSSNFHGESLEAKPPVQPALWGQGQKRELLKKVLFTKIL